MRTKSGLEAVKSCAQVMSGWQRVAITRFALFSAVKRGTLAAQQWAIAGTQLRDDLQAGIQTPLEDGLDKNSGNHLCRVQRPPSEYKLREYGYNIEQDPSCTTVWRRHPKPYDETSR